MPPKLPKKIRIKSQDKKTVKRLALVIRRWRLMICTRITNIKIKAKNDRMAKTKNRFNMEVSFKAESPPRAQRIFLFRSQSSRGPCPVDMKKTRTAYESFSNYEYLTNQRLIRHD